MLKDASRVDVERALDGLNPGQREPWVKRDPGGAPILYVRFDEATLSDFSPEEMGRVFGALGSGPALVVTADISGRHSGREDALGFVGEILSRFGGVAMDDFAERCWSLEEIRADLRINDWKFFDLARLG